MLSESHQGMARISAEELFDLKQWQKVQDLFAEIIGANLWLIEPQGTSLTVPTKVTPSCSDIAQIKTSPKISSSDCVFKAVQHFIQHREFFYKCPHLATYFSVPVKSGPQIAMAIAIGPVIVGKRETFDAYQLACEKHNWDAEKFLSRIREVKLFSHGAMSVMTSFIKELTQHFIRLTRQKQELERLVPGFLNSESRGEGFFTAAYSNLLSNYLLEIASEVVQADSGSVLLLSSTEKSFSIKSAHGLRSEIVKKGQIPINQGIAGWVMKRKKAILIDRDLKTEVPKIKLQRPKIKSSMIIPLEFENKIFGVFCLNAKSNNKRFNKENLILLNQLGKLAGVALSRVVPIKTSDSIPR